MAATQGRSRSDRPGRTAPGAETPAENFSGHVNAEARRCVLLLDSIPPTPVRGTSAGASWRRCRPDREIIRDIQEHLYACHGRDCRGGRRRGGVPEPDLSFKLGCEPGATSPTVTPFNGEQHAGIQVLNTAQFQNLGPLSQVHR